MRTYSVLVTPIAETSIIDAFRFIEARSSLDAARWLQELYHTVATLERYPDRCPSAPESRYFADKLRHLLFHSHRIVFRIEDEASVVRVLYVMHMAQRAVGESVPDNGEKASEA